MNKLSKRLLLTLFILILGIGVFAADQDDALKFFNSFIYASNTYSPTVPELYSDNAKIIRQVVKPDGSLVNVPFSIDSYRSQMKFSGKMAKMKKYKNSYSDVKISKVPNGYKIDSLRKPSLSDYKLKSSMVVQKQPNGKWLIVEEMMQTKEQIFLRYAKK